MIFPAEPPSLPPSLPAIVLVQGKSRGAAPEAALAERARRDGWSESQAGWIGKLGAAALAAEGGVKTLDEAYQQGRRGLSVGYFDNALSQGKTRLVAFLTVIDLEKQVAQRAGAAPPAYSDEALKAAYVALAQAAEAGASSAEQLEIAFASLRK